MFLVAKIGLFLAISTTLCLAAPRQELQLRGEFLQLQQLPETSTPSPGGSGSRLHGFLSAGLKPFQRVSTGALGLICTGTKPFTTVGHFMQTYVFGVLIWILGWAPVVTFFMPLLSVPLSVIQVVLNTGRTVLTTATYLASYGCTVTDGMTFAINSGVNTLTTII